MKIYYEKDVNMDVLKDKTVAVIGYGSQGMAQSRNMADSGLDVIVGLRKGGDSWETAIEHDMPVMTVEAASKEADVIHILIL
jgi:ketol-acid reductoisomerase